MEMDTTSLLVRVFASSLGMKDCMPRADELERLSNAGFLSGKEITKQGREQIRVILAGGVFDIIHPGHIQMLQEAKSLGDALVVVIATDVVAEKNKKRKPLHTEEERQRLVSSLKMVDACIIGNKSDIFETVRIINPDVIVLGYDQIHQEKAIRDGCAKHGLDDVSVTRLKSPMPDMSSSHIRKEYDTEIHGL